ncbi:DNA polymerase IV [Listeria fleischmannii 1991]|uniref:DNA polymerase IV n=2 Tax=Listeria fleischmannii TaxID=1069827 RepID=A0A2X3HF51_9LIST|nr:DNA polymerase IV [Listeria fleischmannii]EMG29091.1 DNA polymerase IV [Listeria fleischmannii subsp. fleischmannii LU2006-1]KMT59492.1 DNA polymerase IV [Listeria fleischmannii 1991]SQC70921.1 DNA polymerase IV [Listeria fleischmannii subsp. fleischmannii]
MDVSRKIIHIDMDAFFASVEQRDHPEYRGKPLIIGGDPNKRGVVSTCSYEARQFGVHSAMPTKQAAKLCPEGIFIHGNMEHYVTVSTQIREIFKRYTDIVEPLSLDEAYLDVTENKKGMASATLIAREIQYAIYHELGLTSSAGVSYNKFIAKIASDYKKPAGLTVIPPEKAESFLESIPIDKFYGVGKVTSEKMHRLGIKTGKDLKAWSEWDLIREFHKHGYYLYRHVRGRSNNIVNPHRDRKSVGKETTFERNVVDELVLEKSLMRFAEKIETRLLKIQKHGKTVVLKLRYSDFTTITKRMTLTNYVHDRQMIYGAGVALLSEVYNGSEAIRLIGLTVTNLKPIHFENMRLEGL